MEHILRVRAIYRASGVLAIVPQAIFRAGLGTLIFTTIVLAFVAIAFFLDAAGIAHSAMAADFRQAAPFIQEQMARSTLIGIVKAANTMFIALTIIFLACPTPFVGIRPVDKP